MVVMPVAAFGRESQAEEFVRSCRQLGHDVRRGGYSTAGYRMVLSVTQDRDGAMSQAAAVVLCLEGSDGVVEWFEIRLPELCKTCPTNSL